MRPFIGFTFDTMTSVARTLSAVAFLRVLVASVLVVVSVELCGIWSELKGIRQGQVKNAAYTLRPEQLSRFRSTANGRARLRILAGQSTVSVEASEPLPVRVEDSMSDPIYAQAGDILPVEIER